MSVKSIGKLVQFVLGVLIFYILAIIVLTNVEYKNVPLFHIIKEQPLEPGHSTAHSLLRFRELEKRAVGDSLDMLFVGSSHSYRSYNPRLFEADSLDIFILGNSAQTPLNSYHLLLEYWDRLNPRLVILDGYPVTYTLDGYEAFLRILRDKEISIPLLKMAFSTRNPDAISTTISLGASRISSPLSEAKQVFSPEDYIPGGYSRSDQKIDSSASFDRQTWNVNKRQLHFLKKIISFLKDKKTTILFIDPPVPIEYKLSTNYTEVADLIKTIAQEFEIEFLDLSHSPELKTYSHFKDQTHLNNDGVEIFNRNIIDSLIKRL